MSPRDWWDRLGSADASIDEELRFHVEERVRELVEAGRDEADARAQVLREFGDPAAVAAACRPFVRQRIWRQALATVRAGWRDDVRLAVRGLVRQPRFGLAVVATLALGLGAAAAVFTVVDGVLLRPLPYRDPEQLVVIRETNAPPAMWPLSEADYVELVERQRSFSSVGAYTRGEAALTGGDRPEWVVTGSATASYFPTMGIEPAEGRLFAEAEDRTGGARVAVVSHGFALRRFGDGAAVGRTIVLDGESHVVVGRLGPDSPAPPAVEVWIPLRIERPERKGPFYFNGYARLRPGVDLAAANADLTRVSEATFPIWAASFSDRAARMFAEPLKEATVRQSARILQLVQAAVGVLLLIACANVANLVLARASARRRELQVRAALGAGRVRLARMLVVEGVVIALVGGAFGLAAAKGAVELFRANGPALPRIAEVALGARTIVAVVLTSLVAGVALGLVPILGAGLGRRARLEAASDRSRSDAAGRLRGAIVVAEFALALPLVTAAALLGSSLLRLQRVDPGFDPGGIGAVRVSLPEVQYPENGDRAAFWDEALRRIRALPEVASAGLSTGLPPDDPVVFNNFELVDRPADPSGAQPVAPWLAVEPGFFEALGIDLLEGRMPSAADTAAGGVVLVSRAWAERYYPGRSAVGAGFREGGCATCDPTQVVGVVEDVKFEGLSGGGVAIYAPLAQGWWSTVHLVFRARGPVEPALERISATLHALDPDLPLTDAATLEDRIRGSLAAPRHWSVLVGSFSLAAALLAAVGVLGLLSYNVSRRTREIGVRIALGAAARDVVRMVVRGGMVKAGIGAAIGVGLSLLAAPLLESQLFGVPPTDPATLAVATAVLLGVAALACWLPARRAARIEPTRAISAE